MTDEFPFTEAQTRVFVLTICLVAFLIVNWGSTFAGLKHISLTVRSHTFDTVNGNLAENIGATIIPFGETMAHLAGIGIFGLIVDFFVRFLDLDQKHFRADSRRLLLENARLLEGLVSTRQNLAEFYEVTDQILNNVSELYKHQDRLVEFSVELETVLLKADRTRNKRNQNAHGDSPDLFDAAKSKPISKTKKRRPPRPRGKARPKF